MLPYIGLIFKEKYFQKFQNPNIFSKIKFQIFKYDLSGATEVFKMS